MNFERPGKTKGEAMAAIEAIRAQINVMGANDAEFRDLDDLKHQLENDTVTPEQAISRAEGIMNAKQDYH